MTQRPEILIAEDEAIVLAAMTFALKKLISVHVTPVTCVKDALDAMYAKRFDLLVTDFTLHTETCVPIVKQAVDGGAPYILVSGSSGVDLSELPQPPVRTLQKPYRPASLKAAVMHALKGKFPDWEKLLT